MGRKPKIITPELDLSQLDEFAGNIDKPQNNEIPEIIKPWENPKVRADVIRGIGVSLTEPYLIKLQFIAKHSRVSMRKFAQRRLQGAIDREIRVILRALESNQKIINEPDWSEPD